MEEFKMTMKFHVAVGVAVVLGAIASFAANDIALKRGAGIAAAIDCTGCGAAGAGRVVLASTASSGDISAPALTVQRVRIIASKAASEDDFVARISGPASGGLRSAASALALMPEHDLRALYRYFKSTSGTAPDMRLAEAG
jgi:hypothetical protein